MRVLATLMLLFGLFLMLAGWSSGLDSIGVFGLLLTIMGIVFQFGQKKRGDGL